jgi:rubrerythrin
MPDTFEAVSQKLMENETAIGRLYEVFGRTFPQDAELWTGLAQDEHRHATWIRHALETLEPEQRQKGLVSIRLPAIEAMLQYVASIAGRCRQGELTRVTALALARDLENSLIESKLLGTLSSGAACLAAVEKSLVEETAEHRKRLADAFERVRQAR